MLFQSQNVFEQWGQQIKDAWETADWIEVWGWIIFAIGILCIVLLIIFTEYKRPERDSIKFSVIVIIIGSLCLGIGLHMILTAGGLW
jgi:hypothetical protein